MKTIKNAMFVNGENYNIIIQDGKIMEITDQSVEKGTIIHIPDDVYVSAGWIDIHTHACPLFEPYCSIPDDIGYKTGVTTLVDAGSCGADDIDSFYTLSQEIPTRLLSFLNISRVGLKIKNELADLSSLSFQAIESSLKKYPDLIVGLKARMSASVVGTNGIEPLNRARQYSDELHVPLLVHIGNAPPYLDDIADILKKGDIITHIFNDKPENSLLTYHAAIHKAIERGVYLDVGHGTSSFSFAIAKKAFEMNIPIDSISTDIYNYNRINGPVYNMATTLNKFLALGYSLEKVIDCVTKNPANIINRPKLGTIREGAIADLTFFKVSQDPIDLIDSFGHVIRGEQQIKPYAVLMGGKYYECE